MSTKLTDKGIQEQLKKEAQAKMEKKVKALKDKKEVKK